MKFFWRSIVLVLVLGSGAFPDLHSQSAHPPFMVGVLQSDGVLIPVARFEAGEWTAPWPEGDGGAPPSLAAVPDSWWPGFSGGAEPADELDLHHWQWEHHFNGSAFG